MVDDLDALAEQFERHRAHLRAVAWRMLGSSSDADDAVQEAWLRLSRSDTSAVQDIGRWLTTVVGRVCLDQLRSRRARREEQLDEAWPHGPEPPTPTADPEREAELADSVGLALLVVLDALEPAERLAFVLHDVFAVPYAEIAPIVERSAGATKMLASRARRRVQQAQHGAGTDPRPQRDIVRAFLAAARNGDFEGLVALLDPEATFRSDPTAHEAGAPWALDGAGAVARQFSGRARAARLALIDGAPGAVWAPRGRAAGAFEFALVRGRIAAIKLVCDPTRLAALDLRFLTDRRPARHGGGAADG